MRNLINFIIRQYFFFLFVLLEVVAIVLIVQNHQYQRSYFINSGNYIAGNIYQVRSNIASYFYLRTQNQRLTEENTRLQEQASSSFLISDQNVFTYRDSLYRKQFTFINAKVLNNTVQFRNNHLTLNKGRLHGIKPDMGVITDQGIVGIVKEVSGNFSSVVSLLHSEMQISVRLKKSQQIGTLVWEGMDFTKATLLYIPTHIEPMIGDTVVSSGFSHIFPTNIDMGTISNVEIRRGDNFYSLEIDLFTDFNKLRHVHVVKNLIRDELIELESR